MNIRIKTLVLLALALGLLSSCIKFDLHRTDHPDHGKITLNIDWSGKGEGIEKPSAYIVAVAGYRDTLSGNRNTFNNLFEAGTYAGSAYNTADKISVNGTKATVAVKSGLTIEALPGWLFTAYDPNVKVEKDQSHEYTAVMQQQVRQLTLVLKPEGGLASNIDTITAELSGIAQTWDFAANIPEGTPASVKPVFIKQTDGTYKAVMRLLGVNGTVQKLAATLSFTSGTSADFTENTDLSNKLNTFNAMPDAKKPLTLSAVVIEMHSEAGFTATITDWTVEKEDITIN